MMGADEKPDVSYADIGGSDIQKQEIREAVELPLTVRFALTQIPSPVHCDASVHPLCRTSLISRKTNLYLRAQMNLHFDLHEAVPCIKKTP